MIIALAWQTTRACLIGSIGTVMLLIYLVAIGITGIVFFSSTSAATANTLLVVFGFSTFFWWAFVSSRLLKVLRDADKWMLPAPMKGIVSAALLHAAMTIVIPSVFYALLGKGFFYALVCLTAVAACGLLFMLLPRYFGLPISLLPVLSNKLVKYELLPATRSDEFLGVIILPTIIMVLVALWRFHRLRSFEGDTSDWSTPLALMPDGANGWGVQTLSQSDSGHLMINGIQFEPAIKTAPLGSPKLALRAMLGAPFMPLTRRSQIKQSLFMGSAYLILPLYMVFSISKDATRDISTTAALAAFWISLLGLGLTFSAVLVRLRSLYTKHNTELAELALLPGWNNGRSARQTLLKVVTQHLARTLLLPVVFVVLALTFIKTENHDGYLIITALFATCILFGAGYGMNIICGNKSRPWLVAIVFIAAFLISMVQLLFSVKSKEFAHAWLGMPAWIAFLAIALVYFYFSWRPFLSRAHPFLRN